MPSNTTAPGSGGATSTDNSGIWLTETANTGANVQAIDIDMSVNQSTADEQAMLTADQGETLGFARVVASRT